MIDKDKIRRIERVETPAAGSVEDLHALNQDMQWVKGELATQLSTCLHELRDHFHGSYKKYAADMLPYFQEAARSPDPAVRAYAAEALDQIRASFPRASEM